MDKKQIRLVIVLALICIVAGGVLAWVNGLTEPRIKVQAELAKKNALRETLPEAVDFQTESVLVNRVREAVGKEITDLFLGYDEQKNNVGVVITVESRGFDGPIQLMIGVSHAGRVAGIKVLSHTETPGLGARITEEEFLTQTAFKGATTEDALAINKDRGEVEAITASTISSRAVVKGVNQALAAARVVLNE